MIDAAPARPESGKETSVVTELRQPLAQGEDGLFHQSWYPVCFSNEVECGSVIGRDFLDGRIVVFRGANGKVSVTSAYCPHLGADLARGSVVGDAIQCAFHHWRYDCAGKCIRTGAGDPPPPTARLFAFPTCEKFGIIWAFNGHEPLWPLPEFSRPDSDLRFRNYSSAPYTCDGWVIAVNTPDMQHIKVVHRFDFNGRDPHELIDWRQWSHSYPLKAMISESESIDWRVGIHGTSIYMQEGTVQDWWLGLIVGMSCPRPGHTSAFACIAVQADDGSESSRALVAERIRWTEVFGQRIAAEDAQILNTIRFRPSALTKADRSLAQFLEFLRNYPRAHPSARFIR
jgi:nitrite reductase/ring-hydroxylating ferredoxin subunit